MPREAPSGEWIGSYRADLIVQQTLIVEVKTGPLLDPEAIPQLLNYLNVTTLPLGLVLFFGPKPKVKRVIRDSTREYPITSLALCRRRRGSATPGDTVLFRIWEGVRRSFQPRAVSRGI